jgi:hypothetical protein
MDFLLFSELRWEVIVHFVDIVGIVNHHCLNYLFIKSFKDNHKSEIKRQIQWPKEKTKCLTFKKIVKIEMTFCSLNSLKYICTIWNKMCTVTLISPKK